MTSNTWHTSSMQILRMTERQIISLFKTLAITGVAPRPDTLNTCALKHLSPIVIQYLARLFKSFQTLKILKWTKSPHNCTNYHPISLLNHLSKLLERLILTHVNDFLMEHFFLANKTALHLNTTRLATDTTNGRFCLLHWQEIHCRVPLSWSISTYPAHALLNISYSEYHKALHLARSFFSYSYAHAFSLEICFSILGLPMKQTSLYLHLTTFLAILHLIFPKMMIPSFLLLP